MRPQYIWGLTVLATALLATACGDGESTEGGTDAGAKVDSTGGDVTGSDTVADTGGTDSDTAGDPDTGTSGSDTAVDPDTGTSGSDATVDPDGGDTADTAGPDCPNGDYCTCQSNADCDSGYCIEGTAGKICAATCTESCTQEGYVCMLVQPPGSSDSVNLCVPKGGNLCNPCKASSECTSLADSKAACVAGSDAGSFCGTTCLTDDGCPTGYSCKDVKSIEGADTKQCVPKDNKVCECSPAAIAKEASTVCYTGSGDAKCEGLRTCLAAGKQGAPPGGGLSACLAPDPKTEACNAIDDDCDGETDESTCDDNLPCTDDKCDGANGCKTSNKAGGCDADGSVCTKDDACKDGKCEPGEKVVCDDNNPCTEDSCDKEKGCTYTNADGKGCDADNTPCTENDACKDGKCEAGAAKACSSDDPCVQPKCVLDSGKCSYPFQDGKDCNDGNACTTKDKCLDKDTGCKGAKIECDDSKPCTADSCDPKDGCKHANVPGACNDGDECTEPDACDEGKCKGKIVDEATKCDDKNPCTKDSCDKAKGCLNEPLSTTACDDGNVCTVGDTCDKGVCTSGSNTCGCTQDSECAAKEDGNFCNGTLYCDKSKAPYLCKVNPSTIVTCETSKDTFCASTVCTPATGKCDVVKKSNGTLCDADQSVCTKDDQCSDGVCTPGDKLACDDKNPCSDDVCDAKDGCKFLANTAPCDADGDACTQSDICSDKSCTAGKKKVCDDGEFCTEDSCDKASGDCKTKDLAAACDDGNACTEGDKCGAKDSKWTCVSGAGPDCDDKNPCTKDSCDKTNGCTNVADDSATVACYTGDKATQGKGICKDGTYACKGGKVQDVCNGEVLPAKEEVCGNSKDDTCNGQTDEGCKPTAYEARFGAAVVTGKVKVGNTEYDARMLVAGSTAAGKSVGTKNTADFGFYAWLQSLLGK